MHLWLGVKNFAKIESAKICIDSYTILVGQNNSGKTFLMQLVQGVNKKISKLVDEEILNILQVNHSMYDKYVITGDKLLSIVEYLNKKLSTIKEEIVREVFGRDIDIEELYIDVLPDADDIYEVDILSVEQIDKQDMAIEENEFFLLQDLVASLPKERKVGVLLKRNDKTQQAEMLTVTASGINDTNYVEHLRNAIRYIMERNSLFLPASRTGLFHLYRDFFVNKADDALSYKIKDDKIIENKEHYGGLTQPMYEFLRFLQTYDENEQSKNIYNRELRFFEEKLIEGHISMNKQGRFSYNEKTDRRGIPMYLASSMINEIAPIALALTDGRYFERLIIDEVEASLHPEKQLQLVRFLNRLNNKGIQLIVSTHSDTFVSKLNNLYMLSKYKDSNHTNMLKKLELEEEDIIYQDELFVYEFVNQANGKSIVKEIVPRENGYQFDLFTKSALQLYEEALKIGEE